MEPRYERSVVMKKEMDKDRIEKAVKEILIAIGENPEREGLLETPKRVAKMYEEIFEGIKYSNQEIAEMFSKCFEHQEKDIVLKLIKSIKIINNHSNGVILLINLRYFLLNIFRIFI